MTRAVQRTISPLPPSDWIPDAWVPDARALLTQAFFTEQLGMPLAMEPNFEDYSCEMVFGRVPPPPEEDPAYKQVWVLE